MQPSKRVLVLTVALCASCGEALRFGAVAPPPQPHCAASSSRAPAPALAHARRPSVARIHMQQIDEASQSFYDEYVETDPVTGESKSLSLGEKEKLYLECLDAYYNEGGKQLLSDDDYEQLKLDLDFEGSRVATFSADEIRFVIANKRFSMGKAIMNDAEYDALRLRLKEAGSLVIIHEGAKTADDGTKKTDLRVDKGKTRLLYLPGTAGGLLLLMEGFFWTIHIDPILSIVLGAVPAYFFGRWFTTNIFAQEPLVTQGTCPDCNYLQNIYFGDLFAVQTEGMVGKPTPPAEVIDWKCSNCKCMLSADRNTMLLKTKAKAAA